LGEAAEEEQKRPESRFSQSNNERSGRFQTGAYRMVFKDERLKNSHHNRLNLRDRSVEPANLFGDQNLGN